jgi:hypothetical protein
MVSVNEEVGWSTEAGNNGFWRSWGPFMTERQWGTVREDYSAHGESWMAISHDLARSYAYRWGEEGIAGFCDAKQIMCLAPAFWNGKDPIIKERLFGLANHLGNHGEDVKELYFHLESTPSHSYCKFLYKYPHAAFPYDELVQGNKRSRHEPEYELLDTGVFDEGRYFDCYIEYAKAGPNDILMRIEVINRGPEAAEIHLLPHFWFRNYWNHNSFYSRPEIVATSHQCLKATSRRNGNYFLCHDGGEQLFAENETNSKRLFGRDNDYPYVKDGINDFIVHRQKTVNPGKTGTKVALWTKKMLSPGESVSMRLRLSKREKHEPWADFDEVLHKRREQGRQFFEGLGDARLSHDEKHLLKSAVSGLLWTKQFYYLDLYKWHNGEPGKPAPQRDRKRNLQWQHLTNRNIISMPDKWEYPWYAAWDLAFHTTTFSHVDAAFAKNQLLLMLREYYMHPNGQIPAYEWNFGDVNPPVHAWAVWQVYERDLKKTGNADWSFLEECFQKLLINFTWWVNRKDINGIDLFEGGFLGLDNIGVFDRSQKVPGVKNLQQADATSWMAMFSLNMLRISLELARHNPLYEESAAKFFRHFINIGWAMHNIGEANVSLWDDEDAFYYDVVKMDDGSTHRLKIRSLVGIIPLLAVEVIHDELFDKLREFKTRAYTIIRTRPDLAQLISHIEEKNKHGEHLFSIMRAFRLEHMLKRLLDEEEFLSEFGIRSLSKFHYKNPYIFEHNGSHHVIQYEPGESNTPMFGGNSNWRGPVWLPLNYLIVQSLYKYYDYYGPQYMYEFPTGSGNKKNLKQIAQELTKRLQKLFDRNGQGRYTYHAEHPVFAEDEHFKHHHLFYEYFHSESGQGLGASHQTGWTALIANLLLEHRD